MSFVHVYHPPVEGETRTLLVLHGTGGDENNLVSLASSLAPGFGILSPRGKVLENGAPRFFRRFAEGVFDYEDIKLRANELADFIEESAKQYGFQTDELTALGYSNGANIAWSTMLLRPDTLAGAVLFRAMVTLTDVDAPNLNGKRIFISDGRYDPIVPAENAESLVSQMRSFGADVTFNWHEGGHELGRDEMLKASEWLRA